MSAERHQATQGLWIPPPPDYHERTHPSTLDKDAPSSAPSGDTGSHAAAHPIASSPSGVVRAPTETTPPRSVFPSQPLVWDDEDRTTRTYAATKMGLTGEHAAVREDLEPTFTERMSKSELEALRKRLLALEDQETARIKTEPSDAQRARAEQDTVTNLDLDVVVSPEQDPASAEASAASADAQGDELARPSLGARSRAFLGRLFSHRKVSLLFGYASPQPIAVGRLMVAGVVVTVSVLAALRMSGCT